jgi:hypothetical protein
MSGHSTLNDDPSGIKCIDPYRRLSQVARLQVESQDVAKHNSGVIPMQ